jgi:hypothetical protein
LSSDVNECKPLAHGAYVVLDPDLGWLCYLCDFRGVPRAPQAPPGAGRGLHPSTAQLNLSRFCNRNSMQTPNVFHKSAHDEPKRGRV